MAAAAGAGAEGDKPPFLAELDEAAPERFYMPTGGQSFPSLSDASVEVAGGRRLPVHSHYLAGASPVLCEACAVQAEGSVCAGARDVATPFSDFSLLDVCAFLCFAYHPHEATPANLAACGSSLPALLQLTHQLQVDGLLQAAVSTISDTDSDLSTEQLQFGGLQGEIQSPTFSVGGTEWRLDMFPTGNGSGTGTHLLLFLMCLSAVMPLTAKYTLTVHGASRSQDIVCSGTATFETVYSSLGRPRCVSLEQLRDPARGHLQGDALRVSAQVEVL
eukprot:scaffold11.g4061.t1